MHATLRQAGCHLVINTDVPAVERHLAGAFGVQLGDGVIGDLPDVRLRAFAATPPFDVAAMSPLAADVFLGPDDVVLLDAARSGIDLRIVADDRIEYARIRVEARFRSPAPERSERHEGHEGHEFVRLNAAQRAVLFVYPALWVAGTRGRLPLCATAIDLGAAIPLLALAGSSGGVRLPSTTLAHSGPLCVSDGQTVHAVLGCGEAGLRPVVRSQPAATLVPDRLVLVRRGQRGAPLRLTAKRAVATLVAGTYLMAELRGYWAFAAALTMATGRGPAHPQVADVARSFARFGCLELDEADLCPSRLMDLLANPVAADA